MLQDSPIFSKKSTDFQDPGKVKILVLGEAGVGKTTFVQSVKGVAVRNPSWTVGCSVEVVEHQCQAGTPEEACYLVELWDVGGSKSHKNSRHVFYQQSHGLILVHDLSNRKSEDNLRSWIVDIYGATVDDSGSGDRERRSPSAGRLPATVFDTEALTGDKGLQLPMLVVGSKQDLAGVRGRSQVASECGVDELTLDCRQPITAGSTNGLKLAKFFDRVIQRQLSPADKKRLGANLSGGGTMIDRRRRIF